MLGTNRKLAKETHVPKRIALSDTKNVESHTLSYNLTKYEKFFHYYTACGVLVQTRGAIEVRKLKFTKSKDAQTTQLVYKHSKEPVYLALCDESSANINSNQECDIDLLVDDNSLRMSATVTSYNAMTSGQAIDGDQLLAKRRKNVEQGDFNDSAEELLTYLRRAANSREFNSAIDNEKPHQFLANNLIDLVLFSDILAEHVCVYLVPIPELRRTRVQFYWCVRETKTPFSPLVAQWMLQNYTDRHGNLTRVENCERRTTRTNNPDLALLGSLLANLGESNANARDFDTNEDIQTHWGALRENVSTLSAVPGFVRPQVPAIPRETFYDTTTFSKTFGFMEVLRINQNHADATKLSQHSRSNTSQDICQAAFSDDTLVIDENYQEYYESHDLKNANSDVFKTHRRNANVSTDEMYTFSFFVEDLRRYCNANTIADPEDCAQPSALEKKKMRFECLFDNTDMLMMDDSIQKALRTSGFVVLSMNNDFESAASSAPKLDDAYCFYLEKSCRCTETQLSLCTLLNYVARLEIEQIEPYAYEPPLFCEATNMQAAILQQNSTIKPSEENDSLEKLYLTAQQASAFRWIREREEAIKSVKDRDVIRSIAIGSTGWYYDCVTCKIYHDESYKRKVEEALHDNHVRIKRRKVDKDSKEVDSSNESMPFYVEAFSRNHAGRVDSTFLNAGRRIYQGDCNNYDTLFLSGGPATGKKVSIMCAVLYELSPLWQCQKTDEEWRGKNSSYQTRSNAKKIQIDASQAYFRQNWFKRSKWITDVAKNLSLARSCVYYFMKLALAASLSDINEKNPLVQESDDMYVDNSSAVATSVLQKIVQRSHEDVTVQQVFTELWRGFMMVHTHHKLLLRNGPTYNVEAEAMAKLVEKEQLIRDQEPAFLQHCNLMTRATLILCSEDDIERWIQAIGIFDQNIYELPNDCWRFVAFDDPQAPVDASIYIIRSLQDWQSFNIARCMLSDIVILTFDCIAAITVDDAHYLSTFRNNVENLKSASFCSTRWMRCVRQHMSVVECTPCAGLVKSDEEIANMSAKKRAKFRSLEQIPLEAIRWQRVVISNLEDSNRNAQLSLRGIRERHFENLSQFFDNLRAVRRIYVDSKSHTPRTFIDTIFPTMKNSLIKTVVGDPMTPNNLQIHKQRWKHPLGTRMSVVEIAHLHPLVMLCYARKFQSMSVQSTHQIRASVSDHAACKAKLSNPFVEKDVCHKIELDAKHETVLKNVLIMLRMVQDLQALYRASDSALYTKISMPAFFTEISQWSTLDIFKGVLGYRAPAEMLMSNENNLHQSNSAISAYQTSNVPTHIFASKDGEFVRLVRMMDRFDPVAWRDFYFSRNAMLQEPATDVSDLKPTYRFIFNAVTHAPHLATAIFPILKDLLVYRDARLLSTMTRSNTDTPEFPFTRSNGAEILSRSALQMNVILADRARRAIPPPPPPPQPQTTTLAETSTLSESPMLTPRDNSLLNRWYEQTRNRAVPTVNFEFEFPSPLCLQLRSAGKNEANQQEMLNASELNDFRDFLFWRINTSLADDCYLQAVFQNHTRPDIATAVLSSEDFDGLRVPINKVELLSPFATTRLGYRHAQVSMSDRCMFAICDAATNANKTLFHSILRKKNLIKQSVQSQTAKMQNSERSLNDPNFISASGLLLVGSDEDPGLRTAPQEMQRLTRRSILNNPADLRKEFYAEFVNGLDAFYYCSTNTHLEEFANNAIFDSATRPSSTAPLVHPQVHPNDDDVSIDQDPILDMDDVLTFDEEGQVNIDDDNVEQILEQLVDNTVITLPRSTALKQRPDEPKVAIDIAINSQMDDIKDVIHRYIVTEQNLLFERRCKDWMIIQFVRSLDQFIANFNSHVFFRKMPLLCNMDEQFGKVGEEKTEKQEQFSKLHRFHSQSQLLRSAGDKQLNFNSEQMNAMAIDHLRHHDQILQPLIEMLIYSGQVHGPMRQVPSNELRALFEESGIGEKEQQELLVKIVGGVRTAAPTYIINMISKFCHETKWIQRDLEFIRQQRERTLSALPSLAKLKRLLLEYRKNPQADAFECPLCMESLCEAEAVALFPCGHMCCYACHSSCNSTVHKPRIDDVAIGVATVGSQCFLCRYLLQFNEKISKVTFSEAVSIVLSTTETTPVQPVIEAAQIDPTQTPTTDRRLAIGPDTTATMLREEFFDYNTSESEGDVILDDINSDDHLEEDFAFADLFDDSSDSGTVPQQSKPQLEPEFLKTGPATDCLIDLFKQYEASCDYSERQIVISYGMMQTMRNIMRRVVKRLMTDGECPNVFVKFVSFPISSEDRLDVLSDAVYNAEFSGKIPVVIYMFHMDLNFSLARDQCLQQLLYINKVNAILMIETPAVRLVDDRASHLLTASIEQRFLSFFCNEFSLIRPTVHRFIIASESMMTVDKSWHDQTRWYAVEK